MSAPAPLSLLLLGGTGEARVLASQLHDCGHTVTYSVAGLTPPPELPCDVISGGFSTHERSGIDGLADTLEQRGADLLIDATHPYAERISLHAIEASRQCGLPCWQLHRPGWPDEIKGEHVSFDSVDSLLPELVHLSRPLFTLGRSLLAHACARPQHQHWVVRSVISLQAPPGVTILCKRGPFAQAAEVELMQHHQIDALITRDSGGTSVVAKLAAAHELDIPVYIQRRARLPEAERRFTNAADLLAALASFTR